VDKEKLLGLAVKYFDTGEYDEAIKVGLKVVEIPPVSVGSWQLLGDAYWNKKEFNSAATYYRRALEASPNRKDLQDDLASSLALSDDFETAIVELKKSIDYDPSNVKMIQALGVCLTRVGRVAESIPVLARSVELEPTLNTLNALGVAQMQAGLLEQAELTFMQALEIYPEDSLLLSNIGDLRRYQGRNMDAKEMYLKALALDECNNRAQDGLRDL